MLPVLLQGTTIGSLDSVEMLFKFIKPLVEEGEDDDDMDEEVSGYLGGFFESSNQDIQDNQDMVFVCTRRPLQSFGWV